ncbi:gamma-glutamyltransferase [Pseudodonghicola flavimaris]|uniref:Glutathione hydrolase proenzyme n=1 Tax=Pseudodonghicola flavimaris TaxID=3050036 RepID=A0ABT7F508_9RHOB|nr:gamma-glutamyltransferase [Pseudodonghicola flavimaris]MDK3019703.1 gamma-glutamyltransferase [Pseudodonghicola flavimaris]
MSQTGWRDRAGTPFDVQKTPVTAAGGMVVTNHPLASAAAVEIMAAGGNAIDALIASLFTLSVVEPMMVGIFGGGTSLIRLASGEELAIDGMCRAPAAARPDTFTPVSDTWPDYMEVEGRENAVGARSICVPGNLLAWCETLERHGTCSLKQVMSAAIRHAEDGFRATPYLCNCIASAAADMQHDPEIARVFLPGGKVPEPGTLIVQSDYAATLRQIAEEGAAAMYGGSLGRRVAEGLAAAGGLLTEQDLIDYRTIDRQPVEGLYRGTRILGAPPPCSGGVHVTQMLNLLEGFDIAKIGFGTVTGMHLLYEVLKIAATDRRASTADPDFVDVPVARLMSKAYGDERRAEIAMDRAGHYEPAALSNESQNTTHVTVADRFGNIVSSTQTINSVFGARMIIPGTGIVPNNYMFLFDPHPGHTLSLVPGKRITSTMSPLIAYRDGRPVFALGLPGGARLYGSAMQAVVNLIDHGMSLQEAVEAPRVWTQGQDCECEPAFAVEKQEQLTAMGHPIREVAHIAGGMCAIEFLEDGQMRGAACWRADGTPAGIGGGLAREGTQFWPDHRLASRAGGAKT